jgi:hypothetical protein
MLDEDLTATRMDVEVGTEIVDCAKKDNNSPPSIHQPLDFVLTIFLLSHRHNYSNPLLKI